MTEDLKIIERLKRLPPKRQEEVLDFIRFIEFRLESEPFDTMLAAEAVLKREWDTLDEDAAWAESLKCINGEFVHFNRLLDTR